MTIGDMIRARARELAQTDEAVARQFDVSSSTVTRWRTGASTPQANKVPALAVWLGVSEAEVIAALHIDAGPSLADVAAELRSMAELVDRLEQRLTQVEAEGREPRPAGRRPSRAPSP